MTVTAPVLLAHASGLGWDEVVFVGLPILVLLLLARQARRAVAAHDEVDAEGTDDGHPEG